MMMMMMMISAMTACPDNRHVGIVSTFSPVCCFCSVWLSSLLLVLHVVAHLCVCVCVFCSLFACIYIYIYMCVCVCCCCLLLVVVVRCSLFVSVIDCLFFMLLFFWRGADFVLLCSSWLVLLCCWCLLFCFCCCLCSCVVAQIVIGGVALLFSTCCD